MPLAAAGVGFTVTLGLLFTLWALMCYTALLLLEVYQHVPADMGLGSLAARAIWAVMGSGLPDSACCFCCTPSRQPISVAPVNYSLPASTSGWTGSYRRPQAY